MRCPLIAALLICFLVATQMPVAVAQPAESATITIPPGTLVPLTLITQVKSKSSKAGDPVRARVAFPVTLGSQLAIPAGTFVEGVILSLTARDRKTHQAEIEIHFTRMLYANGYAVMLDATSQQALLAAPSILPDGGAIEGDARPVVPAYSSEAAFAFEPQVPGPAPTPTLAAASSPNYGPAIGIGVGGAVAVILTAVLLSHRKQVDSVIFDAGWQLQMTLRTPVIVQSERVEAAAASSGS